MLARESTGCAIGCRWFDVVRLTRPVPPGAKVAVTVERSGGVDAPTSPPVMSAST